MSFVPNAAQSALWRKVVKAFNAAVTRMEKSGKYDVVPNRTSMAQEKQLITDRRDFNTRIKQLQRVLTNTRKDAQDVVTYKGVTMPKYMKREIRNMSRRANGNRETMARELIPNWDELSPMQRATVQSNRNLHELHEEDYILPADYDDLVHETYDSVSNKADIYIAVWLDNNGSQRVADMILEMSECRYGFSLLMESPDIEKEIDYVYEGSETFNSNWNNRKGKHRKQTRASSFKEPYEDRIGKAEKYWEEQYQDYLNRTGYFKTC